jgi:tetratricopeptide (TPR) repeat protein
MSGSDELGEEIHRLIEAGRLEEALPLIERTGRALVASGQQRQAALLLTAGARLCGARGELERGRGLLALAERPAQEAGQLSALWRARAELAELARDEEGCRTAWLRLIDAADDESAREWALYKMARLTAAKGELDRAVACYDELVKAAESQAGTDPRQLATVLMDRAACHAVARNGSSARTDLDRAEGILQTDDHRSRARLLGQRAALRLDEGQPGEAIALAVRARDEAVAAVDVETYLAAVLVISTGELRAGREIEAYDALVRARASLKDLLGDAAEELLKEPMGRFSTQLGARFEAVRDAWLARARARNLTTGR